MQIKEKYYLIENLFIKRKGNKYYSLDDGYDHCIEIEDNFTTIKQRIESRVDDIKHNCHLRKIQAEYLIYKCFEVTIDDINYLVMYEDDEGFELLSKEQQEELEKLYFDKAYLIKSDEYIEIKSIRI